MIPDQFFTYDRDGVKPLEIPDAFRQSYRKLVLWLYAHNYKVPEKLAGLAAKEITGGNKTEDA